MIEPDFLKSDPLYTVKEAAGLLGIGTTTVQRMVHSRNIGFLKIRKRIFIRSSDIKNFIELNHISPCPQNTNSPKEKIDHIGTLRGQKITDEEFADRRVHQIMKGLK